MPCPSPIFPSISLCESPKGDWPKGLTETDRSIQVQVVHYITIKHLLPQTETNLGLLVLCSVCLCVATTRRVFVPPHLLACCCKLEITVKNSPPPSSGATGRRGS